VVPFLECFCCQSWMPWTAVPSTALGQQDRHGSCINMVPCMLLLLLVITLVWFHVYGSLVFSLSTGGTCSACYTCSLNLGFLLCNTSSAQHVYGYLPACTLLGSLLCSAQGSACSCWEAACLQVMPGMHLGGLEATCSLEVCCISAGASAYGGLQAACLPAALPPNAPCCALAGAERAARRISSRTRRRRARQRERARAPAARNGTRAGTRAVPRGAAR